MSKTTVVRMIEQREGREIGDLIPLLYDETGSVERVAQRLGVGQSTVRRWIEQLDLKVKRTVIKGG